MTAIVRAAIVRPSTVQPSTVQPSTVQPSTVQPSTVQPSTVQPSTAQPLVDPEPTKSPQPNPGSITEATTAGTRRPRRGVADLPTVTLEEVLAQAAFQTRVDRKYLTDAARLSQVLGAVAGPLRVLAIEGQRTFGYRSTYFDTDGLDAFHDAGRGRRRRFKVRTRVYRNSGDTWLEVKTRGPRGTTVKTRLPYALADAGRLTDEGRAFVAATLAEHHVDGIDVADLAPALHTGYDRATLLLGDDRPSRATIDTNLSWRLPGDPDPLRAPGLVIVETKGGSTPSALDRALWRSGMRPATISKYGAGLAVLDPELPHLKWHRSITHHLAPAS